MDFCYYYSIRSEIKSFLSNDKFEHLVKSIKYFKKGFNFLKYFKTNDQSNKEINIDLLKLVEEAKVKYDWFQLTESTSSIIKAIQEAPQKIVERLKHHIEVELLIPSIDFLILYEFSKIRPLTGSVYNKNITDFKNQYLESFAYEVNNLSKIEPVAKDKIKSKIDIKRIINNTLFSNSIIILLIS